MGPGSSVCITLHPQEQREASEVSDSVIWSQRETCIPSPKQDKEGGRERGEGFGAEQGKENRARREEEEEEKTLAGVGPGSAKRPDAVWSPATLMSPLVGYCPSCGKMKWVFPGPPILALDKNGQC